MKGILGIHTIAHIWLSEDLCFGRGGFLQSISTLILGAGRMFCTDYIGPILRFEDSPHKVSCTR